KQLTKQLHIRTEHHGLIHIENMSSIRLHRKLSKSAREGLQVVLRSARQPQQVAIELNGLTAAPNDAFLDRVFSPWMFSLRRHVLALRTEYQPASVIMSLAKSGFGRSRSHRGASTQIGSVADLRVAQLRDHYQRPPDMDQLTANLVSVREAVAALENRGVKVIYFEYPVPHGLSKTPFHEARRAASAEILGEKAAAAVRFDGDSFQTTDGIHLTPEGQQVVANALAAVLLGTAGETVGGE
ncbi:MAG: hypothetical protein ACKOEM_00615, partial [Planctomycetia bacterium]